jgi:hypothetical protein
MEVASTFMRSILTEEMDPVLVSPNDVKFPSDAKMVVLEPEREDRSIRANSLLLILRPLMKHLGKGEGKAVVIFGLQVFKENNDFRDLTNFIGRLYEEACVNRGLVLFFADPKYFTHQEMAFLEREMVVLEHPEQLFSPTVSETVK